MEFQELSKNIQHHVEYAEKNKVNTIAFSLLSRQQDAEFALVFGQCKNMKLNIAEIVKLVEIQDWSEMEKGMFIMLHVNRKIAGNIPALPDSAFIWKK